VLRSGWFPEKSLRQLNQHVLECREVRLTVNSELKPLQILNKFIFDHLAIAAIMSWKMNLPMRLPSKQRLNLDACTQVAESRNILSFSANHGK